MTASSTLFLSPTMALFPDNTSDPTTSKLVDWLQYQGHYQLTLRRVESVTLNSGGTYAVSLPGTVLASWWFLIAVCQGTAQIQTAGKDTDGTTTINGYLPMYGTSTYPGYAMLSTYNLTSVTLAAQANSTALQIFAAIPVEDGN